MPCMEWFRAQPVEYRESVLPRSIRARVSVEAGNTQPWGALVGLDGVSIGINHFGKSGDGDIQLAAAGISADNVAATARQVLVGLAQR